MTSALATRRDLFERVDRGRYRKRETPGRSRSRATRNRHLCAIRRFYAWAAKRYLPRSPAEGLRAVREDLPGEIVWCDRAERDRIVRAADRLGHGLPVRIAFWAGLRRGEIGRLRARDVDLESGWLSVGRDRATQTKTRRTRRVPIATALRDTLARALPEARQGPLVGWPPMIRDAAQRVLDDLREELPDLARKISWNVFRHSFCSLLAQTGRVSIDQISAIAGHTPEVCRRHYAHLVPRDREATGIDAL